jgi:hypothetical protein
VEEVVRVDVFESLHDLEQNALDTRIVKTLVISRLHQLIQVAFHVLHGDVELFAKWVEEDVQGRNQMGVSW